MTCPIRRCARGSTSCPASRSGRCSRSEAAFETALHWSPGGAKGTIDTALKRLGYRRAAKPMRFLVEGSYGPLRDGELERAKAWGAALAGPSVS